MSDEPETTLAKIKAAPIPPMVAEIDGWFEGSIKPMAFRFDASVYNDFQSAKEELKNRLLALL